MQIQESNKMLSFYDQFIPFSQVHVVIARSTIMNINGLIKFNGITLRHMERFQITDIFFDLLHGFQFVLQMVYIYA